MTLREAQRLRDWSKQEDVNLTIFLFPPPGVGQVLASFFKWLPLAKWKLSTPPPPISLTKLLWGAGWWSLYSKRHWLLCATIPRQQVATQGAGFWGLLARGLCERPQGRFPGPSPKAVPRVELCLGGHSANQSSILQLLSELGVVGDVGVGICGI